MTPNTSRNGDYMLLGWGCVSAPLFLATKPPNDQHRGSAVGPQMPGSSPEQTAIVTYDPQPHLLPGACGTDGHWLALLCQAGTGFSRLRDIKRSKSENMQSNLTIRKMYNQAGQMCFLTHPNFIYFLLIKDQVVSFSLRKYATQRYMYNHHILLKSH